MGEPSSGSSLEARLLLLEAGRGRPGAFGQIRGLFQLRLKRALGSGPTAGQSPSQPAPGARTLQACVGATWVRGRGQDGCQVGNTLNTWFLGAIFLLKKKGNTFENDCPQLAVIKCFHQSREAAYRWNNRTYNRPFQCCRFGCNLVYTQEPSALRRGWWSLEQRNKR